MNRFLPTRYVNRTHGLVEHTFLGQKRARDVKLGAEDLPCAALRPAPSQVQNHRH